PVRPVETAAATRRDAGRNPACLQPGSDAPASLAGAAENHGEFCHGTSEAAATATFHSRKTQEHVSPSHYADSTWTRLPPCSTAPEHETRSCCAPPWTRPGHCGSRTRRRSPSSRQSADGPG